MAERRMFTQKIVDSDAFLDMPLSTQSLYFHLNMRADDDGFVNNPKKIQRMIGASEDDLKLLLAKRFILGFENGVVVIKHWRMHNLLRKDRYNPTQYIEEMNMLALNDNGAYTEKRADNLLTTAWQPSDNQMATQDRIGKDSIGKLSIVEDRENEDKPSPQQIVDLFNSICISFPSVRTLSEARKKAIKARLNTYTLEDFKQCFENAEASSFLKGSNNRDWTATFDWLIKDTNMAKVLEGNYADKERKASNAKANEIDEWFEERLRKTYEEPPKTAADDPELRKKGELLKEKLVKGW